MHCAICTAVGTDSTAWLLRQVLPLRSLPIPDRNGDQQAMTEAHPAACAPSVVLPPPTAASADTRSGSHRGISPALLGGFVALNLLIGGLPLGNEVYLTDLLLVALLVVSLLRRGPAGVLKLLLRCCAVLATMGILVFFAGGFGAERFLPEFLKTALLLVGTILLWGEIGWPALGRMARLAPLIALGVTVFVYASGQGDYYGDEGRFGVPWWGSPNTTAFVIDMCIALWLYSMHQDLCRRAERIERMLLTSFQLVILSGLVAFLLITGSSGGRLALLVILARYAGLRLPGFLLLLPLGAVAFWILGLRVPELAGSGRLLIWQMLLVTQITASKVHWFFGFGPGSINLTTWFTARVQSAHNMFIEECYSWGILAPIMMLFAIRRFSLRVRGAQMPRPQRLLIESVFGAVIAGFLVDTYVMAAQMTWLGVLIFGTGGL